MFDIQCTNINMNINTISSASSAFKHWGGLRRILTPQYPLLQLGISLEILYLLGGRKSRKDLKRVHNQHSAAVYTFLPKFKWDFQHSIVPVVHSIMLQAWGLLSLLKLIYIDSTLILDNGSSSNPFIMNTNTCIRERFTNVNTSLQMIIKVRERGIQNKSRREREKSTQKNSHLGLRRKEIFKIRHNPYF